MKSFVWGGQSFVYDEKLWEETVVPYEEVEEADEEVCLVSLRYVGPIVDGKIVGKVPDIPTMYRVFEGCATLVEPPIFNLNNCIGVFVGCESLRPSLEWHREMAKRPGIVWGNLFDGCNSQYVYDYGEAVGDGIASAITGEVQTGVIDRQALVDLCAKSEVKEGGYTFVDNRVVVVKQINRLSEVEGDLLAFNRKVLLASNGVMEYRVYLLGDDFVVDEPNAEMYKVFGFKVNGGEMKKSLPLGENATLECSGDTVIECGCCLEAWGELRIHGSGSLELRGKAMQPCIGPKTEVSGARGWWKPSDKTLTKIVVDGVRVICRNSVPNFAVGTYGREGVPEICVVNGGSLECPEQEGERVLAAVEDGELKLAPALYTLGKQKETATMRIFS